MEKHPKLRNKPKYMEKHIQDRDEKHSKDNQFKWFQHRIIHRILGTQDLLFKMKITDNPRCRLCNTANETIEHLFLTCEICNELW